MIHYNETLAQLAEGYNKAEREVVATFFSRPRTPEEHIPWLKAQAFKEYSAVQPLVQALGKGSVGEVAKRLRPRSSNYRPRFLSRSSDAE